MHVDQRTYPKSDLNISEDYFSMSHVHSTPTGLSSFVGNVALPALLFKSMLTLKFAALNWNFLFAVFKAKSALFALTSILTAILFYDRERGTYDNCACFIFVSALPLDHQVPISLCNHSLVL